MKKIVSGFITLTIILTLLTPLISKAETTVTVSASGTNWTYAGGALAVGLSIGCFRVYFQSRSHYSDADSSQKIASLFSFDLHEDAYISKELLREKNDAIKVPLFTWRF